MATVVHKNVTPIIKDQEVQKQAVSDEKFKVNSQRKTFLFASFLFICFFTIVSGLLIFQNFELRKKLENIGSNPTPTFPFDAWTFYSREDLGFSLELPQSSLVSESKSCIFSVFPKNIEKYDEFKANISSGQIKEFDLLKIGAAAASFCKTTFRNLDDLAREYQSEVSKVTFNNYDAITAKGQNLIAAKSEGNIVVEIKYIYDTPWEKEIIDKVLSKFRFSGDADMSLGDTQTQEECDQKGGVWQTWGLLNMEYCQIPAPDGGETCYDSSQCSLKRCISYENKIPGECQTYENTFGCFSYIENGRVSSAICID